MPDSLYLASFPESIHTKDPGRYPNAKIHIPGRIKSILDGSIHFFICCIPATYKFFLVPFFLVGNRWGYLQMYLSVAMKKLWAHYDWLPIEDYRSVVFRYYVLYHKKMKGFDIGIQCHPNIFIPF